MSKFKLKIKAAYKAFTFILLSNCSKYSPNNNTNMVYSDIKLLFVQYKTRLTIQLMWIPSYLSVEDHIRNKLG